MVSVEGRLSRSHSSGWDMPLYIRLFWNQSDGATNSNLKFYINIYGGNWERGAAVSVYRHLLNTVEALSWLCAAFHPVVFGFLLKWWKSLILIYHALPFGEPLIAAKILIFQHGNNPKHTGRAVKAQLDRNVQTIPILCFNSRWIRKT